MTKIFFELNNKEGFFISTPDELGKLNSCSEGDIIFYSFEDTYLMAFDLVLYFMNELSTLLPQVIIGKLRLHQSITEDIGYLSNEYLQDKPGLQIEKIEGFDYWVGLRYSLWSSRQNMHPKSATWLYNDREGNIVFEITPRYPWHYVDPKEDEIFVPYDKWIKDYKPFLIRMISQETARQWLDKANEILKIIQENNSK